MVDAPVSGGVGGAAAGTLTIMVGGTDAAFNRAKPYLDPLSKLMVHAGGSGNGQAAKACNNMILGITMIGVCEAFVLGEKLGLDHAKLFEVTANASGQCWTISSYCPVPGPVPTSPANRDYAPGFAAALMLKDLRLAQEAALASGATTPLGAQAAQLYALFEKLGHGGERLRRGHRRAEFARRRVAHHAQRRRWPRGGIEPERDGDGGCVFLRRVRRGIGAVAGGQAEREAEPVEGSQVTRRGYPAAFEAAAPVEHGAGAGERRQRGL